MLFVSVYFTLSIRVLYHLSNRDGRLRLFDEYRLVLCDVWKMAFGDWAIFRPSNPFYRDVAFSDNSFCSGEGVTAIRLKWKMFSNINWFFVFVRLIVFFLPRPFSRNELVVPWHWILYSVSPFCGDSGEEKKVRGRNNSKCFYAFFFLFYSNRYTRSANIRSWTWHRCALIPRV